ncbi:universal stress protein [Herbiconiux ginsengi]|uniref:Nucleotide-binding universal stress protein, UspA family n=1 Tax=Herbiconiux ginsengi TaxID=381665 RepID=A0A1H3SWU4_9MICO|nr:universal stress protein [Herbiconiux ginsengi]SDZ42442.1 Nucleotide-binding universal stress protein, UspA family [Herbiconiux ginsengi]
MSERTVVAWDGSATCRAAVDWAIDRARREDDGHEFELAHVIDEITYVSGDPGDPGAYDTATAPSPDDVDRVRRLLPRATVSSRSVIGDPVTTLRRYTDPDTLLVIGTEARTVPHLRFSWSVGSRVAARALGPVAIIPRRVTGIRSGVVAGVDGSPASLRAALLAASEAQLRDVELRLVNAWLEPPLWQEAYVFDDETIDDDYLDEVTRQHQQIASDAAAVVRDAFPLLTVTAQAVHGYTVRSLLLASPLPELVVVGCRSRSTLSRLLLGSASRELIQNLDVPVVVVSDRVHDAAPGRPPTIEHGGRRSTDSPA